MNERIEKLAEQAGMVRGGYANTPEKIMTWREHFDNPGSLEKFAELIVKECLTLSKDTVSSPGFAAAELPATRSVDYSTGFVDGYKLGKSFAVTTCDHVIRNHFGIKE